MEPQIRYVKTADGVNIAYYEMGEGVPFVYMILPFSHLTAEWERDAALFTGIASNARLVRFDPRGFGLSDRNPDDLSLDAFTLDLEAVVDRLNLARFILQGTVLSSLVAVNYAARHPERVLRLVLVEAAARNPEVVLQQAKAALATGEDWRFVSETMTRFLQGWDRPDDSARSAAHLRDSVDLELVRRLFGSFDWDVTGVLPLVRAPALVVNSKDNPWAGVDVARELVAGMPNAQLAIVRGVGPRDSQGDVELAIRSFLGAPTRQRTLAVDQPTGPSTAATNTAAATAIILFADIVDSTGLTERMGDGAFREKARALDHALRVVVHDNGGAAIDGKLLGDGILATFPAASQGILAALSFEGAAKATQLQLHVGLHAGDVIREQDAGGQSNVYGGAVNIASRISALAPAGEVFVSDTVRSLARTSAGVSFEDRGEHALKGIAEPQRVFAVRVS